MAHQFDATLKDILAPNPEDFVAVFGLPRLHPMVSLNVDLSAISAATDVAIGFGDPLQEVADLNFQSGPDPDIAARCHLYSAALHFRFGVPVRTLVILLRAKAESGDINGKLAYTSGASGVEFRYEVIRMWQQPVEPFLRGGVSALPLATLCHLPANQPVADALRGVVREIEKRLANECQHAQAARLMTAAYVLTGLRVERTELGPIYDGVRLMHESSAYELILEEGGIREAQRILLRLGKKRLGSPDETVATALKAINDLDRLEQLTDAVLSVSSWQELLAKP